MKKYIILLSFALLGCTDNKKIIQESKQMHADSAKVDSIKFQNLKKEDEKINGIILDGKYYSPSQLDSIFTGKK